jgi:hypothetical protein
MVQMVGAKGGWSGQRVERGEVIEGPASLYRVSL